MKTEDQFLNFEFIRNWIKKLLKTQLLNSQINDRDLFPTKNSYSEYNGTRFQDWPVRDQTLLGKLSKITNSIYSPVDASN